MKNELKFINIENYKGEKINFFLLFLLQFSLHFIFNFILILLLMPLIPLYPKIIFGQIMHKLHKIYWYYIYCHPKNVFRAVVKTDSYSYKKEDIMIQQNPEIIELHDIFVNEHCIVFSQDAIYRNNLHNYHDASYLLKLHKKRTPKKLYLLRKMLMMEFILSKKIMKYFEKKAINFILKNRNIIKLDNKRKKLLFLHLYYVNYAHFLNEMMPNLYLIKDNIQEYDIIIPSNINSYDHMSYILPVIKAFGGTQTQLIFVNTNEILQINNLITFKGTKFNKELYEKAIDYLINFYKKDFKTNLGNKLYFQRKGINRSIQNESEVEKLLLANGFHTVQPEKYDLIQQMSMMQHTEYIVGINGTAIHGNILFAKNQLTVIEIRHYSAPGYPTCVTNFIKAPLRYIFLYAKLSHISQGWFNGNIIVDIKKLTTLLRKMHL